MDGIQFDQPVHLTLGTLNKRAFLYTAYASRARTSNPLNWLTTFAGASAVVETVRRTAAATNR
jgi:hypothetical protein